MAILTALLLAALCGGGAPALALTPQQATYLRLAEQGSWRAQRAFKDDSHGIWNGRRNVPLHWYDERLHSHSHYPLATIWGAVPLFETLAAIATADPTAARRAALAVFAVGTHPAAAIPGASSTRRGLSGRRGAAAYGGAEAYWDQAVGGFAPYPGDRSAANSWFDDNSWLGIAFVDAYRALGQRRLLKDAQAAFEFVARRGWDTARGGVWWNTDHTPAGEKSGEALAAASLLGALLAQSLQQAGAAAHGGAAAAEQRTAAWDLRTTRKLIDWGDANFTAAGGLYARTQSDPTPMPYVAGPEIEAHELLCQLTPVRNSYCGRARSLSDSAYRRFAYRLNMGPQFDVIYLHWMLLYGQQTGDSRWAQMALKFAAAARRNALEPTSGLYLRAWDGSDMSAHQAEVDMLRTDAATLELFAWLAALGP